MSNNNNSSIKDFFLKLVHSYQTISKIFIFLCAVILVVWQMPRTVKFKYEYQKMKPWQYESLYAPFNFPIYKTAEEIKLEEDDYLKDSYPIFTYDNVITKQNREKMLADFDTKWTGNQVDKLKNKQFLERLYDTIENQGIIANISSLENMKPESMIDVVRDRVVKTRQVRDFYTMKTATNFISDHLLNADEGIDKAMINRLLLAHIHQNIRYSSFSLAQQV